MVSKDNVIETNTRCVCGNGDIYNFQKNYFKNVCPNCGKEGTLQLETENNVELSNNSFNDDNSTDNTNTANQEDNVNTTPSTKIVCKNCGSQYCGQDGYDLDDPNRNSLSYVNPNEITDDDEDSEASSTEEGETTYMSGWEGLCDLLKPLDGQAMMLQRGDFVIIKKIEMPQSARLWAYEGINVVDDSVTVTDYTPEIYNTFIIKWGESFENELEFVFEKHKRLFGERKIVIEAKKYHVVGEDENSEGENTDNENKDNGGSVLDWIFGSSNEEEQLKNTDTSNVSLGDDATDLSGTGTGEGEEALQTEEVPITDREEAKRFGLTQVGKAKREDGHTIELKVIGNSNWQMGEWCHVRLPSFNEDSYMFISKCSFESSADSEYICSLTLVDYPPSLGKPSKKNQGENNESEESDSSTTGTNDANSDTNTDSNNNENTGNDNGNNNNSNNNNDNTN